MRGAQTPDAEAPGPPAHPPPFVVPIPRNGLNEPPGPPSQEASPRGVGSIKAVRRTVLLGVHACAPFEGGGDPPLVKGGVHPRPATSIRQPRHHQMEQGPTEPHAGRSTFLPSSGGAGGGYYRVAVDAGPITTKNQVPWQTFAACLVHPLGWG